MLSYGQACERIQGYTMPASTAAILTLLDILFLKHYKICDVDLLSPRCAIKYTAQCCHAGVRTVYIAHSTARIFGLHKSCVSKENRNCGRTAQHRRHAVIKAALFMCKYTRVKTVFLFYRVVQSIKLAFYVGVFEVVVIMSLPLPEGTFQCNESSDGGKSSLSTFTSCML